MPGPAHCTHWHTGHSRNQEKANMAAGHEKMKPPLVTSSACIEYQVICPGWPMILPSLPSRDGSHEARLRVWWWTISVSTVLSSLHRSSAWLVNSNNFLHLDQSQILGLATPHLWSQYPVPGPGIHHPLVWLHRPGVAVTHITRLTTTEIWYWIDTIKFLAAIESFFVQFYCRFVFSLSANKHRDQTHTAADWQKETEESSIDNGWFDGWVVVFAGHHSHN